MRKILVFLVSFTVLLINAQFVDDMESYTPGQPISGVGPWLDFGCGGGIGCALMSSSEQAHYGSQSGLVPGDTTTDVILDLGNNIFGTWSLQFYMYVPSNKEAYWSTMSATPTNCDGWTGGWFYFNQDNVNPGIGLIDNIAIEPVVFNFPHDEWFEISMCWDISLGVEACTWGVAINNVTVIPIGTAYKDAAGDSPSSLGGINYYSISPNNLYYLDDFYFDPDGWWCWYMSVTEIQTEIFTIFPNPVQEILNITSNSASSSIEKITLYGLMGKVVLQTNDISEQLDVSMLKTGVYLVKIETDKGIITKKVLKE